MCLICFLIKHKKNLFLNFSDWQCSTNVSFYIFWKHENFLRPFSDKMYGILDKILFCFLFKLFICHNIPETIHYKYCWEKQICKRNRKMCVIPWCINIMLKTSLTKNLYFFLNSLLVFVLNNECCNFLHKTMNIPPPSPAMKHNICLMKWKNFIPHMI